MATFPESIASIALVVDSRDQNQSFCPTAHSERFSSNPIRHTISLSLASGLCDCLWCLISLQSRSFSNINVTCYHFSSPINLFRNDSILFHFNIDSQMEIRYIKFLALNHLNIELLCVSSLTQIPQNSFMMNVSLLSYVITVHDFF